MTAECSGNYKRLLIAWFATADALEQPGEPVELPPPMEAEEEQPEPPPMPPPPPEEEEEEEEEDPNSLEAVAARLGIDEAELEKLREKFDRFDADGSGAIDAAEVRALRRAGGFLCGVARRRPIDNGGRVVALCFVNARRRRRRLSSDATCHGVRARSTRPSSARCSARWAASTRRRRSAHDSYS